MNAKEVIEVLDTVADILLEINDQFDIEVMFGFDLNLNIESDYNRIINLINVTEKLKKNMDIPKLEFRIITKKGIAFNDFHDAYEKRNSPAYIRRKKMIAESASSIMTKLDGINNRLLSILDKYKIKISDPNYIQNGADFPFLLIGSTHGVIKLPLYKGSLSDDGDIIKMRKMKLSSYEEDKKIVDNNENIQLYYAYVPFEITKIKSISKKTFKDRIKKFIDFL